MGIDLHPVNGDEKIAGLHLPAVDYDTFYLLAKKTFISVISPLTGFCNIFKRKVLHIVTPPYASVWLTGRSPSACIAVCPWIFSLAP